MNTVHPVNGLGIWGLMLVLVVFSLSGCMGPQEAQEDPANGATDDEDDRNGDDDEPPAEVSLTLEVQDPVQRLVEGESVDLQIQVSGDEAQADWAGIRWGEPSTAGDDAPAPTDFEQEQATDGDRTFPGEYRILDWTPQQGEYYVRAHVQVGAQDFWSDEFHVEVVPEVEEGDIDADHVISIGSSSLLSPGCDANAPYDPDPVEINAGEAVRWTNEDGCGHTASHDADEPQFDTGNIGADATSHGVRFNKAGTYEYYCALHPQMTGTIDVTG